MGEKFPFCAPLELLTAVGPAEAQASINYMIEKLLDGPTNLSPQTGLPRTAEEFVDYLLNPFSEPPPKDWSSHIYDWFGADVAERCLDGSVGGNVANAFAADECAKIRALYARFTQFLLSPSGGPFNYRFVPASDGGELPPLEIRWKHGTVPEDYQPSDLPDETVVALHHYMTGRLGEVGRWSKFDQSAEMLMFGFRMVCHAPVWGEIRRAFNGIDELRFCDLTLHPKSVIKLKDGNVLSMCAHSGDVALSVKAAALQAAVARVTADFYAGRLMPQKQHKFVLLFGAKIETGCEFFAIAGVARLACDYPRVITLYHDVKLRAVLGPTLRPSDTLFYNRFHALIQWAGPAVVYGVDDCRRVVSPFCRAPADRLKRSFPRRPSPGSAPADTAFGPPPPAEAHPVR